MKIKNLSEVEGFKEYSDYSVTSDGDVISHYGLEDRILKQSKNSDGYLRVGLSNHGNRKTVRINIIVARAFCEGYSPELEVDHINFIRTDNKAKNLQYLSRTENIQKSCNKSVAQLTLKGKLVKIWKSATEAKKVGKYNDRCVSQVSTGDRKSHAGFNWCFEEDLESNIGKKTIGYRKKVAQLDKENNIIKIWDSAAQAEQQCKFNSGNISSVCSGRLKTSGGFKWRFTDIVFEELTE